MSRLNKTKKVLAIFGFICYYISRKGKENSKNQKGKIMEKINLNKLYNEAVAARIAAEKNKADLFVEKVMIPELIETAENGENHKIFYIPGGLKIAFVLEAINEKVEYTEVKQDEKSLAFYWG